MSCVTIEKNDIVEYLTLSVSSSVQVAAKK
jgi:hypothetical protein